MFWGENLSWKKLGFLILFSLSFEGYANPFIMSQGQFTLPQIVFLIAKYNPTLPITYVEHLAQIYLETCLLEGVNQDIALAQMFLETAFLRFGGIVNANQNNFAGLGAVDGQDDAASFSSPYVGIKAHIQHLKGYASLKDFKEPLYDTRLKYVERGSAPTISELTGRWATDTLYDQKLHRILNQLKKEVQDFCS